MVLGSKYWRLLDAYGGFGSFMPEDSANHVIDLGQLIVGVPNQVNT